MQNLLDVLLKTLKNDERLLVDGKLAKNKIIELALAMDESLITLLIKNKPIKKHFFKKAGEALVFDKVVFQSFDRPINYKHRQNACGSYYPSVRYRSVGHVWPHPWRLKWRCPPRRMPSRACRRSRGRLTRTHDACTQQAARMLQRR